MDTTLSRRALLGMVAAGTVATAGCASESSPGGERMTTGSSGDGSATVRVRSHPDFGDVLVGPEGMTLYMFDQDTQGSGASSCDGGCADNWPPLTVDDTPTTGEDVSVDLSTFDRDDGATQVAANGWPLYYVTSDAEPGDTTGQGANDVWWVLRPDGSPVRSADDATSTETETDSRY